MFHILIVHTWLILAYHSIDGATGDVILSDTNDRIANYWILHMSDGKKFDYVAETTATLNGVTLDRVSNSNSCSYTRLKGLYIIAGSRFWTLICNM